MTKSNSPAFGVCTASILAVTIVCIPEWLLWHLLAPVSFWQKCVALCFSVFTFLVTGLVASGVWLLVVMLFE